MGKRYQAIMDYLDIAYVCYDIKLCYDIKRGISLSDFITGNDTYIDRVIIASPTPTHYSVFKSLTKHLFQPKILCEKPLSTDLNEVLEMVKYGVNTMMQYRYLRQDKTYSTEHDSSYNYFRSGSDGIAWDCFQIIAFHNGPLEQISLKSNSPIWKCSINSDALSIRHMDRAYVDFFKAWLAGDKMDENFVFIAHKRVLSYLALRENYHGL
jgi:hypothetical protein